MGLTLFALHVPGLSPCFPRFPPQETHPVSPSDHVLPQDPRLPPRPKFNSIFALVPSCPSAFPLVAIPWPFPSPVVTFQNGPHPSQFARFSTSSTNSPCPFAIHDQRTIPALTFPIPSLTQPDFSYFFTHPPLSFERPPSAISGKDIRPPKHEQGRAQSHSTPASGVNAPLSKCGP